MSDRDSLTPGIDYMMAWNGGLQDYTGTSSFGDLNFGNFPAVASACIIAISGMLFCKTGQFDHHLCCSYELF